LPQKLVLSSSSCELIVTLAAYVTVSVQRDLILPELQHRLFQRRTVFFIPAAHSE